jgi:hypothetical protein
MTSTEEETACRDGNLEWITQTIQECKVSLDQMIRTACRVGNLTIVEWLVTHITSQNPNQLKRPFDEACVCGHAHVVEWFVRHQGLTPKHGLRPAIIGRQPAIIDLLISLGASPVIAARHACEIGDDLMVSQTIALGADINTVLIFACRFGRGSIVDMAIEMGATDFTRAATDACRGGNYTMMDRMIALGANRNDVLSTACLNGPVSLVKKIHQDGATALYRGVRAACESGQHKVLRYLLGEGALVISYDEIMDEYGNADDLEFTYLAFVEFGLKIESHHTLKLTDDDIIHLYHLLVSGRRPKIDFGSDTPRVIHYEQWRHHVNGILQNQYNVCGDVVSIITLYV